MSKRLSWDIHTRTQIISLGPALLRVLTAKDGVLIPC